MHNRRGNESYDHSSLESSFGFSVFDPDIWSETYLYIYVKENIEKAVSSPIQIKYEKLPTNSFMFNGTHGIRECNLHHHPIIRRKWKSFLIQNWHYTCCRIILVLCLGNITALVCSGKAWGRELLWSGEITQFRDGCAQSSLPTLSQPQTRIKPCHWTGLQWETRNLL